MNFSQIAVEVGAEDLAAGVEAVAAQAVLQLGGADLGVVGGEPAAGLLAALVAVDADELCAQLWGGQQVGVGAGDGFRSELDRALTALELLNNRLQHRGPVGTVVEDPGVIGHAQRIPFRIDAPVALAVLLPKVLLGSGGRVVVGAELAHAGAAADVAGHDCDGSLIDQQAALHRGELAALGLIEDLGHAAVEVLELHRVGHATEALEGFAHGPHVGEIDADLNRAGGVKALVAAEIEQQLIAVHPAAAGISHLDGYPVGLDAMAGVLLALASWSGTDIGNSGDAEPVAHRRQAAN